MQRNMKVLGTAALAMLLSVGSIAQAQPTAGAAKASKAGKGAASKNRRRGGIMIISPRMLAQIIGKPLTPAQRKSVESATKIYTQSIAKAVGMSEDELKAKAKAYRATHRRGPNSGAPGAPPAKP